MKKAPSPSGFLSYGKQWIDSTDIDSVIAALKSDYLTQGPAVAEFEESIIQATGARYCVALANGTAALHLAVAALDIRSGSGITSPITFVASANCMAYNGIRPDFADIEADTACLSAEALERRIRPDTKLVIPVHFAGQPADMAGICKIAKDTGLRIIEDAAHAIGSINADGSMVGACSASDMTIFSFHPVKTITTAEGGAITTNDKVIYERLCLLRSHGITRDPSRLGMNPGPWYYEMQDLGFNYRLTDIQAALGSSQMSKLGTFVHRRREIVDRYREAFSRLEWIRPLVERSGVKSAFHLFTVRINFDAIHASRSQVMRELEAKGIGTQVHYIPVHLQPFYGQNYGFKRGDFPAAEDYYETALSLPLFPKMTDDDVDYVIEAVRGLGR